MNIIDKLEIYYNFRADLMEHIGGDCDCTDGEITVFDDYYWKLDTVEEEILYDEKKEKVMDTVNNNVYTEWYTKVHRGELLTVVEVGYDVLVFLTENEIK